MSGICGIFKFDRENAVDPDLVRRMSETLRHRGPDEEGVYINKNVGIAIRQLNVINFDNAHQPIHNEDESVWIVLDGEVYNYSELRDRLQQKGHRFYSSSDTETIVHLYEELGNGCVSVLRGMFAFVLVDIKRQRLLLARDRMGQKPLYYSPKDNEIAFGSEVKAIIQYRDFKREVNLEALDNFMTYNYVPSPLSMFKNIDKVPPAHILSWHNGDIKIESYWDYTFLPTNNRGEDYYAERLYELMEESVRMKLKADVPIGAFLSGGTDTSAVVGFMSQIIREPIKTFSVGFEDEWFSELPFARIVANHFKTEHYEIIVTPNMAKEFIPILVQHYDEPFADSSAIPTYYGCKLAREHVKVVLTGDGPDQMLAGSRHYLMEKRRSYLPIPEFIRRTLFAKLTASFSIPPCVVDRGERIKRILKMEAMSLSYRHITRNAYFPQDAKQNLYSDYLKEVLKNNNPLENGERYCNQTTAQDFLDRMLYIDTKMFIPDDLMVKVDRGSMALGLQTRKPFLDSSFVNFTGTIPANLKLKGIKQGNRKYILKKALSDLLPRQTIEKKKHGFEAPVSRWFRKELKSFASEILFDAKTQNRVYFNYDYIRKLWSQHQSEKYDHSLRIWALITFELWHRFFID